MPPRCPHGAAASRREYDRLVSEWLTRSTIYQPLGRMRRAFTWRASEPWMPASVPQGLATVEGLRVGKSSARETDPILPVADAVVEATLPNLPAMVADRVRVQRLTGMRPSEVCRLRPTDLDR